MRSFSFLMVVSPKDDPSKLVRCLNSLISQSSQTYEILIVINGPIPESLSLILQKYENDDLFRFIKSADTLALGLALNLGKSIVSTKWLLRIDPDDICLENRVALAVKYVEESNFDLAFFSNYELGDHKNQIFKRKLPDSFNEKKFMTFNPSVHSTALIKMSALNDLGWYRDIYLAEDYELWLRFILSKKVIKFFPDFVIIYDAEGLSKRRKSLLTIYGEFKILSIKNSIKPRLVIINYLVFLARVLYRITPSFIISSYYSRFISKRIRVEAAVERESILKYL
jgi:glycosyltransferase involved in cell wall biosynthesis